MTLVSVFSTEKNLMQKIEIKILDYTSESDAKDLTGLLNSYAEDRWEEGKV